MVVRRIAVTGGPGGGKTTLWRALAERHADQLLPVPEVATLMFQHVFPAVEHEDERRAVQRSIFRVQHDTEAVYARRLAGSQCLLVDRGTPDGGAYWPEGHEAFFREMGTDHESELARYDAVLFLETAAAGGLPIDQGNPTRLEDLQTAVAIDRRLLDVWSCHPRFAHIPQQSDFAAKLEQAAAIVTGWL